MTSRPRCAPGDGRRRSRGTRRALRSPTAGIDALLVTHLPNVRYLTGFTGQLGDAAGHRRRARVHLRRPVPHAGGGAARRGAASTRSIEIGATVAQQTRSRWPAALAAPAHASGSKPTRSRGRSSATSRSSSTVTSSSPPTGSSSPAPGQGAGRGRPHPRRVLHRRRRPRRAAPAARRPPHRTRLRARPRGRDAPAGRQRQQLRPDRGVGSQRREAARPPERPAGRAAASSSSSTSAASSTATAPT